MDKKFFLVLFGVLLLSSSVIAGSCSYPELLSEVEYFYNDGLDKTISVDGDQRFDVYLYRGGTITIGGNPSSSYCKYNEDSWYKIQAERLYDGDEADFKVSSSGSSGRCYKLVINQYVCGECKEGRDDCEGHEYFECEDSRYGDYWDSQGIVLGECGVDCLGNEEKCIGTTYYRCDDYEWDNRGIVVGECNVDCLGDSDCSGSDMCVNGQCERDPCEYTYCDEYCSDGTRYSEGYCVSSTGSCVYETTNCAFGCDNDFCRDDPCAGVDTSDRCEDGKWYTSGSCTEGSVTFGEIYDCEFGCQDEPSLLSVLSTDGMCRSDACDSVSCDNYCSGETLYSEGYCSSGECIYPQEESYAEECGFVPIPNRPAFIIGISIILVLGSIVGIVVWRKGKKLDS